MTNDELIHTALLKVTMAAGDLCGDWPRKDVSNRHSSIVIRN
jgi:hypothetical protein